MLTTESLNTIKVDWKLMLSVFSVAMVLLEVVILTLVRELDSMGGVTIVEESWER